MATEAAMTPREALASLGEVSRRDEALKTRTEGLTWVIWGMVNAGVTLTYLALGPADAAIVRPWEIDPMQALASVAWVSVGIIATVGLWRSVALTIRIGITRARGIAFFVAWPLLTGLLTLLALPLVGWEQGVLAKTVAIGLLLVGFAFLDPLGFTMRGRGSALMLGICAIGLGIAGLVWDLDARASLLLVAASLGVAWCIVGLDALLRG